MKNQGDAHPTKRTRIIQQPLKTYHMINTLDREVIFIILLITALAIILQPKNNK